MLVQEDQLVIPREQAIQYLKIYNGDIEWDPHLKLLFSRLLKKYDEHEAKIAARKQIACTILLPTYDNTVLTDPPENLLFWCSSYHQFNTHNWVEEFFKITKQDKEIEQVRNQCLNFGFVHPLEYNPMTRQAFFWLLDQATQRGDLSDDNKEYITQKLANLVYAYGGAVICSIFGKPEFSKKIEKLHNWRSGYFFERLIFEVYKPEELFKIKQKEIAKIQDTNHKLVKRVKGTR